MSVTSGLAYLFFTLLYYDIDIAQRQSGWPFHYLGTNSILIYIFHEVF